LLLTSIGILATIFFYISLALGNYRRKVKEKNAQSLSKNQRVDEYVGHEIVRQKATIRIKSVLANIELYKVAFVYTFSRLFLLICIIYLPIWLNELVKMKTGQTIDNIAIIPLTFFASSFTAAIVLKHITHKKITQSVRKKNYNFHRQSPQQQHSCIQSFIEI
jgi:hypothetical protein